MMWRVTYKKVFLREMKKLPKNIRAEVEQLVFVRLPTASNPFLLPEITKLTGYREYYKARIGDYRIGLRVDQQAQVVECCRVKHRREIYRFFP